MKCRFLTFHDARDALTQTLALRDGYGSGRCLVEVGGDSVGAGLRFALSPDAGRARTESERV